MLEFLGHRGRILVILILLATLLGIVLFLNEILFPFLLASFLAYVLAPVIENLHQRKIRSYSISRGTAGVEEDDVFIFSEFAFTDEVDQSSHTFSGINRIQQDSFLTGQ